MPDVPMKLAAALSDVYRIERELGQGGMATVYLARDLRHNRPVALKVLKPELGAVLGVERFLSEIQVTANLQHPNLLPLFDSGEANGLLYYVMPYVEGETLRHRLDREKQLPIDESLHIAVAIAGALDYAHQRGVVHRDLKPENILLQHGQPVLADFGIALAVANAGGTRVTQTGLSLGTPKYMSPEQATGDRVIDGRTDIYSLAAVLYECLTGEPPHEGNTAQAIIARLLSEKPRSVRSSRERVPDHVEAAIERGLAKLAADRFSTARDFAQALSGPPVGTYTGKVTSGFTTTTTADREVRITFALSAARLKAIGLWTLGSIAVALGILGWIRPRAEPAEPHVRFALDLTDSLRPREDAPGSNVALSPDGTTLVYVGGLGTPQLFMRRLDDREPHPVPGTAGAINPKFSPDGLWLAFQVNNTLKRMPVGGGSPITVADGIGRYSWGDGDVMVVNRAGSAVLTRLGDDQPLTALDTAQKETVHTWPEVLPGGKAILFTIEAGGPATGRLAAMNLSDRKIIRFDIAGQNPRYVSSGHVLLGRLDGTVVAVPFDARRLEVTGRPSNALDAVVVKGGGATELAVSSSGTMAYVEGVVQQQLVLVDRAGLAQPLLPLTKRFFHPRVSPAGNRIAITITDDATATPVESDIWIVDLATRQLSRLTNDGRSSQPEWTPDGLRLVWLHAVDSVTNEVRTQAWDGSGRVETIATPNRSFNSAVPSPSGGEFLSSQYTKQGILDEDIWTTGIRGGESRSIVRTDVDEYMPRMSPDGKWLAYYSGDRNRSYDVYVTPADGSGSPRQLSTGGVEPMWGRTGSSLFFRGGGRMIEARITSSPFRVTFDSLFVDTYRQDRGASNYDVMGDGRFVLLRNGDQQQRLFVTLGWFDDLRARMGQGVQR